METTAPLKIYKVTYTIHSHELPKKKSRGRFRPQKEKEILLELRMRCRRMGLQGLRNEILVIATSEAEIESVFNKKRPKVPHRSYVEIEDIRLINDDETITREEQK